MAESEERLGGQTVEAPLREVGNSTPRRYRRSGLSRRRSRPDGETGPAAVFQRQAQVYGRNAQGRSRRLRVHRNSDASSHRWRLHLSSPGLSTRSCRTSRKCRGANYREGRDASRLGALLGQRISATEERSPDRGGSWRTLTYRSITDPQRSAPQGSSSGSTSPEAAARAKTAPGVAEHRARRTRRRSSALSTSAYGPAAAASSAGRALQARPRRGWQVVRRDRYRSWSLRPSANHDAGWRQVVPNRFNYDLWTVRLHENIIYTPKIVLFTALPSLEKLRWISCSPASPS